MITPKSPRLFVTPEPRYFGAGAEAELARELAHLERSTVIRHVGSAAELCLDGDGLLPGGFIYTEAAFKQVCAVAARGLDPLVRDLAGVHRTDGLRGDYSFAGAIELFNAVIRRRFRGRFDGKVRIVKNADPARKLVDGVLGPKYNFIENRAIYDMARDAAASGTAKVRFHEAALEGRRFILRFIHRRPIFEVAVPGWGTEAFFGGYHFSNSEIAGEASVRAAVLLLRTPTNTVALGRFGKGRLPHVGKDFGTKLNKMFQAVLSLPQDAATLKARYGDLHGVSLGLGGTEQEREAQLDYLGLVLHRQGLSKAQARGIALAALHYGSYDRGDRPRLLDARALAGRNAYDLYTALTREAPNLPLAVREAAEQAAYNLLHGKIKLR